MTLLSFIKFPSCALAGCIFLAMLMPPALCAAGEEKSTIADDGSLLNRLDKPRDYLSERFVSMSSRIDGFFGDDRVFKESRSSYLRLYGDLVLNKSGTSSFNPQIQAKLVLPALEKRLHLLIETDANTTVPTPATSVTTQKGVPDINAPKDFFAALQMLLVDTFHWNINTSAGLRVHALSLDPFARVRAGHTQDIRNWQLRFTESVYWFAQSGAGESTQYDADFKISDAYLARSRTVAAWSNRAQQFDFQQGFYLFHPMNDRHALSYQVNVFGASRPNSRVTEYDMSVAWRYRLHREWLFVAVQPGISWPETEAFHVTPAVLFRLEAIFGESDGG